MMAESDGTLKAFYTRHGILYHGGTLTEFNLMVVGLTQGALEYSRP